MRYTGEGCWSGVEDLHMELWCENFWQAALWKTEKGVRG
jgi:hypothetical protein